MTPEDRKAIAAFQNIDLALCNVFRKHDEIDTRLNVQRGRLPMCADIPKAHAESIAAEVTLDLARIAIGSRP